ncbi:MAG: 30S ribosomal protein S1 [Rhodospirillaceae bacterium]|nr:30S ribosomal protein S1 [Rhodospirillaceae bacterium]|tara:strand:+ start:2232 stop:4088 length:1857 start_codon:yes stop_codon:yes gene_type:complete
MTDSSVVQDAPVSDENFEDLFNEFLQRVDIVEGAVVEGTVVSIQGDAALIDVGLKAEGRIALREFTPPGGEPTIAVGDKIEVFVERLENRNGETVLSREKAQREEVWNQLEAAFENSDRVKGYIVQRVKGGFTVNLGGAFAFLPGSQVDIRPVRDVTPLMGDEHEFRILKMDRRRGNIVVSRRSVLEDERADQRADLITGLTEGQVLDGMVKNITDYGAFVDLGGLDGLLHVTDISWRRINHPTEALSIGQTVRVQVIRFNPETQRISLGMKQLEADPWEGVAAKYPASARFKGRVTNITDYGAFVELEPGIEGLVHVSEMSWTRKNVHPGKIVSTSQEVDVEVLDVDSDKRRISLGIKQTQENPWDDFLAKYPIDSEVEGEVKNITEFGLFIDIGNDLDGMVHMSDLSWDKTGEEAINDYKKGDQVKAKVLDVDIDKERISLGVKQLQADPLADAMDGVTRGSVVTCVVSKIVDNGVEVLVDDRLPGFIRKAELARERGDQRPDRFVEGDRLDAKVTAIDRVTRRISLSVKALEIEDEKKAMKTYGSADSGATLGDILGAALSAKGADAEDATAEETAAEEAPAEKASVEKAAAEEAPAEDAASEDTAEAADDDTKS